jgi:Transcriptional regulator PadR-like family
MAAAAKDVVLGLIVERADYGYSLVQRFEGRFGYAAFAESIVYSALDSLQRGQLPQDVEHPVGSRQPPVPLFYPVPSQPSTLPPDLLQIRPKLRNLSSCVRR